MVKEKYLILYVQVPIKGTYNNFNYLFSYVNLFSWGVVELEEGDHDIWVSSISKQPINVNPVSAPW